MYRTFVFVYCAALWTSVCNAAFQNINGQKCSVAYSLSYKYDHYYNVTDPKDATSNGNQSVLLRIYVQALSNAHVMLTAEPSSFGYEIVLGGGGNSFCEIRKSNRLRSVVTVNTRILDIRKANGFWIQVTQESGMIEVGRENETLPFMFWIDQEPIPVKYFAFSAWEGVVCKWLFNCRPLDASAEKTSSVDTFFTYLERLKKDVLKKRGTFGPGNPPLNDQQMLTVEIASDFKFVHLDVMTSTLTIQGYATFEWMDNSITWDPKNYKNISKLHLSNYELWQPELIVHNALDPASSMFSEPKISINSNGKVIWRPKFSIKTKCDVNLKSWPWDRHECTVLLSTWSHKIANIFYKIKDTNRKSECFQVAHSDWRLESMSSSYVNDDTPWDDVIASINNDDDPDTENSLQIIVEISRNTKILEKIFYGPLILISCLWLSSFFVMPDSSSKITTICVSITVLTITIAYMTTFVPVFSEYPPNLLIKYLKLMFLISTDAFVSSCLIVVHGRRTIGGRPPFALTRFLTTPVVTRLLMLPKLESDADSSYGHLRDDDVSEGGEPSQTASRVTSAAITLWDIVIVAFERLVFAAYLTITSLVVLPSSST